MRSIERPGIRLVYDRTRLIREDSSPLRLQFLLPIAIPHIVVVADVREYRFHDLERAVAFIAPKWIFDFRRAARFDGLAGGRTHAFRIFDAYGVNYIDILNLIRRGIPFLEMKRKSLWIRTFQSVFRKNKNVSGPILILSDDPNYFFDLSSSVIAGLKSVTGVGFGLSVLPTSLIRKNELSFQEVM